MKPHKKPQPCVVYLNDLFRVSIERDELPDDPRFIRDFSARVYDCTPPHMWSMLEAVRCFDEWPRMALQSVVKEYAR